LIRNSTEKGYFTLTAKCAIGIIHTRIHFNGDGYEFSSKEGDVFSSLHDLVQHYMDNPDHLQTAEGVALNLKYPMPEDTPTRERWFHGSISGHDAQQILQKSTIKEGSFLVRDSRSEPGSFAFAIKIKQDKPITHVKIRQNLKNRFQLEPQDNTNQVEKDFATLDELVENYKSHGLVDKDMNLIKFSIPVPTTRVLASEIGVRITELEKSKGRGGYFEEFQKLQEYEAKLKNTLPSVPEGKKSHNMAKNRYRNIVPYDDHRVTIGPEKDYINASYIPHIDISMRDGKKYISTQGPIPDTIRDFWRMIYYENAPVIVMTALAIESARKKCEEYWPKRPGIEGRERHGDLEVELIEERKDRESFIVRKMVLEYQNQRKIVTQYQFLKWPDFDVPNNPGEVLEFLGIVHNKYMEVPQPARGPIVVHCSAGIGRSGAFIVCDMICDQIRKTGQSTHIDIKNTVQHCRMHRPGMVQTEGQYTFIYKALEVQMDSLTQRQNLAPISTPPIVPPR